MGHRAAEPLVVEVHRAGDAVVVRLAGSADGAEAEGLRARLEELADLGAGPIVMDLGNLAFICSAGLGALLGAYGRMGRRPGAVRLVHPQPFILRLLETTCLTRVFPVYSSVDDALSS